MFLRRIWREFVRKKVRRYLCRISPFNRSNRWRCSAKRDGLKNFAIFTGKHLCWSLFTDLQVCNFFKKRTPTLILFCEFCQTLKNIYFEEHSRTSASYFMKKNRQSWRLNNSGEKFLNQWKSTGKDTLRKFLFRAFHEIQFQGQFMKHEILS